MTRHFYELGWSGIDIEPLPEYVSELRLERSRDVIVAAVAGQPKDSPASTLSNPTKISRRSTPVAWRR